MFPRASRLKKTGSDLPRLLCWLLIGVVVAHVLLASPSTGAAEEQRDGLGPEPIRIAAIFSLTGIAARHNMQILEVILATAAKINTKGGVLGRPLELKMYDNESTPIGSLTAARQAVADGVTAVIGAHWSSHSLAMAPYLQNEGVPMISPASTNPDVTIGRDYIFRVCFIDTMQGKAMARFAAEQLKVDSVGILYNVDERYSIDLANYFQTEMLLQGRKVSLIKGYRGVSTDFSKHIASLLRNQPDAVYIPGYTRDTALFMKQARKQGVTSIFLGGDGWDLIEKLVDKEVDGSYQTVLWHPDMPFAETREALKIMHETSENMAWNLSAPMGYDAVMVLADAIRRAGTTDRARVRDALAATRDFPGVAGPITFDSQGDPVGKAIVIVKFEQQQMKYVTMVTP